MRYPIPPGNARAKDVTLRWYEQVERTLRGLWWVENLCLDERIEAYQVTEVKEALLGAVAMLEERERREVKRARIEQLERTDGRTPEEAALYLQKARELRERDGTP